MACSEVGISLRTCKRWYKNGEITADKCPEAIWPQPVNRLSNTEQETILAVCNEKWFASLLLTKIVPALLGNGVYYASESTFYRLLKHHGQLHHRGSNVAPKGSNTPGHVYI
ncbi:MAG: hypothetical protein HLX52_04655 [Idiomarinaceae bacterium]|uniref:hypothetical protein n=1 Tax=Idiomarina sp. 28-8 TaxID=1260624 RepID=UPI000300327E|nr:hypothetical protein [Idiomarina sp. 28-8]NWO02238.1 hypothetical protein [Idiomarinaceae bacterium]